MLSSSTDLLKELQDWTIAFTVNRVVKSQPNMKCRWVQSTLLLTSLASQQVRLITTLSVITLLTCFSSVFLRANQGMKIVRRSVHHWNWDELCHSYIIFKVNGLVRQETIAPVQIVSTSDQDVKQKTKRISIYLNNEYLQTNEHSKKSLFDFDISLKMFRDKTFCC